MTLQEELSANDVNVKDGLDRLLNNQELYERLLKKLPEAISQNEVLTFIDSGDITTAINNAHTIKGVTGNLSITPLFQAYTEIVALLRADKVTEARELYIGTQPVQKKIIDIINKY